MVETSAHQQSLLADDLEQPSLDVADEVDEYKPVREGRLRLKLATCTATALVVFLIIIGAVMMTVSERSNKRSLVLMVSDGMGPASLSMSRTYRQLVEGRPFDDTLTLDSFLVGSSRTRSSNYLITDSAAGATAFSCGSKTNNEVISVLSDNTTDCRTILEAAKQAGYLTGLVVSTHISDATPAAFNAHATSRWQTSEIALQQIGQTPLGRVTDLMIGGGRCYFLPNSSTGSCREDDIDVIGMAKDSGFHLALNYAELKASSQLPLLALLADKMLPYDIDRDRDEYPSLLEMTQIALQLLTDASKHNKKGFFLMVEGSRIDHAGHDNDPPAQIGEVLAYDKAFGAVNEWLKSNLGALISVSDHETGGLSMARQFNDSYSDFVWYPEVIANVTKSSEKLAQELTALSDTNRLDVMNKIRNDLGISAISDDEIDEAITLLSDPYTLKHHLAKMVSVRAQIGWSTHSHSAVDVPIFFSSSRPWVGKLPIAGNVENTKIGEFMRNYLSV